MAITISNCVGQKPQGINLPEDVITIKKALNQIPILQGGFKEAPIPLKMDENNGLMDEKTLVAIQKFQIQHFGWNGADRRIYPNSVTINKINELLPSEERPIETSAKSNIFFIQLAPAEVIFFNDTIFMIIDDIQNRQRAKYKVIRKGDSASENTNQTFTNQKRILWQGLPISVKDLDNAEFILATAARNEFGHYPEAPGIPQIVKENMLGIKTVHDSERKEFHIGEKPYLFDVTDQALSASWGENAENWIRAKIVGKLNLIEFESW